MSTYKLSHNKWLSLWHFFQILQIVHTVEECPDTLAFATEPILASLANILAYHVSFLVI